MTRIYMDARNITTVRGIRRQIQWRKYFEIIRPRSSNTLTAHGNTCAVRESMNTPKKPPDRHIYVNGTVSRYKKRSTPLALPQYSIRRDILHCYNKVRIHSTHRRPEFATSLNWNRDTAVVSHLPFMSHVMVVSTAVCNSLLRIGVLGCSVQEERKNVPGKV